MIHLYCGDGKGKTTAAMGLAVRAVGRGWRVVIAQFLKGTNSGERLALTQFENVTLLDVPEQVKFSFRMNEQERTQAKAHFERLCEQCEERIKAQTVELMVLDEVCAAVSTGLLSLERVLTLLDSAGDAVEVVLTGRNPAPALTERADYITEMKLHRHPFQRGIHARYGVEL